MNESINVTREQVERAMKKWLAHEGVALSAGVLYREHQAQSFTTALFNNVKVEAQAEELCVCVKALASGADRTMAGKMCDTCFYTETDVDKALHGAKRHHSPDCTNCTEALADTHVKVGEEGEPTLKESVVDWFYSYNEMAFKIRCSCGFEAIRYREEHTIELVKEHEAEHQADTHRGETP